MFLSICGSTGEGILKDMIRFTTCTPVTCKLFAVGDEIDKKLKIQPLTLKLESK